MKFKTRWLLFLALIFSFTQINAEVQEGSCGTNVNYIYDDDTDILSIIGSGEMSNYSSASAVPWSNLVGQIKEVDIKEGVTNIGDYAFYGCKLLWTISIPSTVTKIGAHAFDACEYLFDPGLPESVTSIGAYAYRGCTRFETVTIPSNVSSMGECAFYACNTITKVVFKTNSLTSIPNSAFYSCTLLDNVELPSSVKTIGSSAFASCVNLTNIKLSASLNTVGDNAFAYCSKLDNVTLTDKVKTIGSGAFQYCKSLSAIDIPSSVLTVNANAFINCTALKKATMHVGLTTIGNNAFSNCTALDSVSLPRSVYSMGESIFSACTSMKTVTVPNGFTLLPKSIFSGCTSLYDVHLPNTLTQIDDNAFYGCTALQKIDIPFSVCTIGNSAFAKDSKLDSVYVNRVKLPLATLETNSFEGLPSDFVIVIPCSRVDDYRTADGWSKYADNIYTMPITYKVTLLTNNALLGDVKSSGLICGEDGVTDTLNAVAVTGASFQYWSDGKTDNPRVIEVSSDTTVKAVFSAISANGKCGESVTWELDDLGTLTISGEGAMFTYTATNYKNVPWYNSYRNLIKKVVIKDGVTSLGAFAFRLLTNLTEVDLSGSVTSIGKSAFNGCSSLSTVVITDTTHVITPESYAFTGSASGMAVYVPCSMYEQYEAATEWAAWTVKPMSERFKVTLNVNDAALGSVALVNTSCDDNIVRDTILATPVDNISFSHWKDEKSNTNERRVVEITSDTTLTAIFSKPLAKGQCGDDLYWQFTEENDLIITGTGKMWDFSSVADVPWVDYIEQIQRIKVNEGATSIGKYAFFGCSYAEQLSLPESLVKIGSYAFYSCMVLENVALPSAHLDSICSNAFYGCASLRSIVIPSSVTYMGSATFCGCTLMQTADVKAKITYIPDYTFSRCNALSDVKLPSYIRGTGDHSFAYCYRLASIDLPDSLRSFGNNSFLSCRSLKSIECPDSLVYIGGSAFSGCSRLETVTFSDTLQTIGQTAFYGCSSLTNVKMPETITSIGDGAFGYCRSLTNIEFPKKIQRLANSVCIGCTALEKVKIPVAVTTIGTNAFNGCTVLDSINFPLALNEIGASAFANCTTLKTLHLPANIQTLGDGVFTNCTGLTEVKLPLSLATMGGSAFSNCTGLTSIEIPTRVLSVGGSAFSGCTALDTVLVTRYDDELTTIGTSALNNTKSTLKVYFPCSRFDDYKAMSSWSSYLSKMYSNTDLYKVTLSVNVDTLGSVAESGAFCAGNAVKDSIYATAAENGTFLNWSDGSKINPRVLALTSDTTLKAIFVGKVANGKCGDNLTWVLDSRGVLTISGTGKMYNFTAGTAPWTDYIDKITSVVVEDSAESVGDYAFYGCNKLETVELDSTVKSIGKSAFENATAIQSIKCENVKSVVSLGNNAFKSVNSTFSIYVPCGFVEDYQNATNWNTRTSQIKSFGDLYQLTVKTNDASLGTAKVKSIDCVENGLVGNLEATSTAGNRFSFWSDDEENEDFLRQVSFNSDTTVTAMFAHVIAQGKCGDDLYWSIDDQGKLVIDGTGPMYTFTVANPAGWSDYIEDIKRIVVHEGATTVGNYAFYACTNAQSIKLPSTLTSIGSYGMYGCAALSSLTLPSKLKTIGNSAFYSCSALEQIEIPASVTSMGAYAFAMCSALDKATVNASITTLSDYTFSGCTSLSNVTLPGALTAMSSYCFNNCRSLQRITIPAKVKTMGTGLFQNCVMLETANLPEGLTSVPANAFYNCVKLDSIAVPSTVNAIGASAFYNCKKLHTFTLPYAVSSIGGSCFYNCALLESVKIPSGIVVLEANTFANCTSLQTVTIPNTVTTIGSNAFSNCPSITYLAVPSTVTSIGTSAFAGDTKLDTLLVRRYLDPLTVLSTDGLKNTGSNLNIYVPCSRVDDYKVAASWKSYSDIMNMESYLYDIALYPNYKSRGYAKVIGTGCVDSVSVDTIRAFSKGCARFDHWSDGVKANPRVLRVTQDSLLKAVFYADTMKWGYFDATHKLKWTIFCDSLLIVEGEGDMPNYDNPKDVPWYPYRDMIVYGDVLEGVTSVGKNCFYNDSLLVGITLPKGLTTINDYAFAECTSMDTLTIPKTVTTIGREAFSKSNLKYLYVPSSVSDLGDAALSDCNSLRTATLSSGITELPDSTFAGCANLKSMTLPNTLNVINANAFKNCTSLQSVGLSDSLTTILDSAFMNCSSLSKITLPDTLDSIAPYAFYGCTAMDTVECLRTATPIPSLGTKVFNNESGERTIYVDCNIMDVYKSDSEWSAYKDSISTYGKIYILTLLSSADTDGTAEMYSSRCSRKGTRDSILATPIGCHQFSKWSDGNTDNPREILLTRDSTLTAVFVEGYIDAGSCGENMTWTLHCDSILEITGKGNMNNFNNETPAPWSTYAADIKGITLSDKITSVGDSAFTDAVKVAEVLLPKTITRIGASAFANCTSLETVKVPADAVPSVDASTFYNTNSDLAIYVPCSLMADYKSNEGWQTYTDKFTALNPTFAIRILANADSLGKVEHEDISCIDKATTVELTAKPNEGAVFDHWENGDKNAVREVNISTDTTITAYFKLDSFTVTAIADDKTGTTKGSGRYEYGSKATVIAIPNVGYHFMEWSTGAKQDTLDTLVTKDVDLTANFAIDTFQLTVKADGKGKAYTSGKYLYGDSVAIHAKADTLNHFLYWSNGSKDTLTKVRITSDSTLIAYFGVDSFTVKAVNEAGEGTVTGVGSYPYGESVKLIAVPADEYVFAGWADNTTKSDTIDTTVTSNIVVRPIFKVKTYTLTLKSGDHGSVVGGGEFVRNDKAPIEAVADEGYHLKQWSNGSKLAKDTIVIVSDSTITATFAIDTFKVDAIVNNGTVSGTGVYDWNETATLIATADKGYHFVNWEGVEKKDTISFTVKKDTTLTALFEPDTFTVKVSAVNGTATGSGRYAYYHTVKLSGEANEHYHFVKWSDGSTVLNHDIVVRGDTEFVATFAPDTFYIEVKNGKNVSGDHSGYYAYGDTLHMTAVPDEGHHFMGWSTGDSTLDVKVPVTGDAVITPIFKVDSFLIDAVAVNGAVEGTGTYAYGDTASLKAVPAEGYHFMKWSTGATSSEIKFEVKKGDTLTATFAIDTFWVNIDSDNVIGAKSGNYLYGDSIKVTAKADYGYHFSHWSTGDTTASIGFRVTGDTALIPYFEPNMYRVDAIAKNGKVEGTGEYAYADTVTLKAVADEGYHFIKWTDGAKSATNKFAVKGDTTLTANFAPDTFYIEISESKYVSGAESGYYAYNDTLRLKVSDKEGYHFVKWSNGETDKNISIVVKGDSTISPVFAADSFKVDALTKNGKVEGLGTYAYGVTANLKAVADRGYHFQYWTKGDTDADKDYEVTKDTVFTPVFAPDTFYIEISESKYVSGAESGNYAYHDTLNLTVKDKEGYHFVEWSNGKTDKNISIVVESDSTISPVFAADSFKVDALTKNGKVEGLGTYAYGVTANLKAVADKGYHFQYWTKGDTDADKDYEVTKDTVFTPVFAPDTFYIEIPESKYVSGAESGNYAYHDTLNLTVKDKEGYHFVEWSNGKTDKNISIVVESDSTISPVFAADSFKVDALTENGKVEGLGTYAYGVTANLKAVADKGYHFQYWTKGDTDADKDYEVTKDTVFEPVFAPDTFKIAIGENVKTDEEFSGDYPYGETLELEADSVAGYHFVEWSNGETTTQIEYVVSGNDSIYPIFAPDTFEVDAIAKNGEVEGLGRYAYGDTAKIVAVADDEYVFVNWGDEIQSASDVLYLVVKGDTTLTPVFEKDKNVIVDVYDIKGRLYKRNVHRNDALLDLGNGVYVLRNTKTHKTWKAVKRGGVCEIY